MSPHCQINFEIYRTSEELSKALNSQLELFSHSEKKLKQHKIPKKNLKKGHRVVWEIKSKPFRELLGKFHSQYYNFVRNKIKDFPLPCIHGFLDKRSIVTNAQPHAGKLILLKADIKNFFGSITIDRIEDHFLQMNLSNEVSECLSKVLTVNGVLPQGFCTSPLISNLIFLNLDRQLLELAKKYNCQYTRYADDITFSSDHKIPTQIEIANILHQEGFELEPSKFRIKKNGQSFYVTGLNVSTREPRVSREWKQKLRQELYFIEKFGFDEHAGRNNYPSAQVCVNKIKGQISFLNSVEPQKADKLRCKIDYLLKRDKKHVCYSSRDKKDARNIFMYVDEQEQKNEGMFFLCLVVVEDSTFIENSLRQIYRNLYLNPYLPGKDENLDKGILHWSELTWDAKTELVRAISVLPFEGFIAFKKHKNLLKETYLGLFSQLLKDRFWAHDGDHINILVENNSIFKTQNLQKISDDLYLAAKTHGSLRPQNHPIVKVVPKKANVNIALPDCLLGVLGSWLSEKEENLKTTKICHYEQIKQKIKRIKFISNNICQENFNRNNPLRRSDFNRLKVTE